MSLDSEQNVNELIGARIQAVREAKGFTLRELAKKLGVSHTKVHTMEQGANRILVSDLLKVAEALDVQPLVLLQDLPPLADIRTFFRITFSDLAGESVQAIDEMVTFTKWLERRWRMRTSTFYRPMLYSGPSTLPIEFDQEWHNPILREGNRFLYVTIEADGVRGRFFDMEIAPSDSPLEYDKPRPIDSMWWETEEQLDQFLRENGYCWQHYPLKTHHSDYCISDH